MPERKPEDLLPLTAAHFHILLTLVEGARHGYAVKREVEERTDGQIRLAAGSLYESIQRLVRTGLLEETDPPADGDGAQSSRWRFYAITGFGSEVLTAELERLEADVAIARGKLAAEAPGK